MRLLQLSDPHFGTEQPRVVEALLACARQMAPDVIVLSGDITQRATRSQFQAARVFFDRLEAPYKRIIPGNHDIPLFNPFARLFWPYARFREAFGAELESDLDIPGLRMLALNTTRPWRHKDGTVSSTQMTQVAQALRQARSDQLKVVVVHQPVAVSRPIDEENRLHGHAAAVRSWSAAGAHLILAGHIHLPCLVPLQECYPELARPMWAAVAGTAVSSRVRYEAGNSFNLVCWERDDPLANLRLERWDYQTQDGVFIRVANHELAAV